MRGRTRDQAARDAADAWTEWAAASRPDTAAAARKRYQRATARVALLDSQTRKA